MTTIKNKLMALPDEDWQRRTDTDIAAEYGCSHTFVWQVRRELGQVKQRLEPKPKKTGIQLLKEKFGIPVTTNSREAVNMIIREHIAGGAIVMGLMAKVSRMQHGKPPDPFLSYLLQALSQAKQEMADRVLSWTPRKGRRTNMDPDRVDWSKDIDWSISNTELAVKHDVSPQLVGRMRKKYQSEQETK